MSAATVSVTNLVLYLDACKVPHPEIDRIVVILVTYKHMGTGNLVSKIGAKYISILRTFINLEKERNERRKRIRDLVATTVESMEGEDTATKRARLESVILAVHTLGVMSQSKR